AGVAPKPRGRPSQLWTPLIASLCGWGLKPGRCPVMVRGERLRFKGTVFARRQRRTRLRGNDSGVRGYSFWRPGRSCAGLPMWPQIPRDHEGARSHPAQALENRVGARAPTTQRSDLMRRSMFSLVLLALMLGALSCARKEDAAQQGSTVDSLLASNPTEQTSGNLTPQTDYQQPEQQAPPTPAPRTTRPKP